METVADAAAFAPGTLIGDRYLLDEPLGRGGMAEVWGAVDQRLDRRVAVKALVAELAADAGFRARFAAEARAVARLSHPNVVGVFDTGEHAGRPFLVMERLPGQTLADRVAAGALSEPEARSVAFDVLGALSAAHAAGIVHRDIKPANILLLPDGSAKVADFGIAKLTDPAATDGADRTATNILVGTPAYLAPERVDGFAATPASDLYALGVVLYEALSGSKPFNGDTPVAVAMAAQEGARPLTEVRPGTDPDLTRVIHRAMAADPTERFASAAEMASALGRGGGAAPTIAAGTPDATSVIRVPARASAPAGWARRGLVPVLVAVAVALIVAAVALASTGGDRNGGGATAAAASSPLGDEMRALAARLDAPNDGPRAPEAGERLVAIAALLDAGDGEAAADAAGQLSQQVRDWHAEDALGNSATSKVLALLARVPGADVASTTSTTARPLVEIDLNDEKDERKRGEKKDDD